MLVIQPELSRDTFIHKIFLFNMFCLPEHTVVVKTASAIVNARQW